MLLAITLLEVFQPLPCGGEKTFALPGSSRKPPSARNQPLPEAEQLPFTVDFNKEQQRCRSCCPTLTLVAKQPDDHAPTGVSETAYRQTENHRQIPARFRDSGYAEQPDREQIGKYRLPHSSHERAWR
jgi:hypothetical protein